MTPSAPILAAPRDADALVAALRSAGRIGVDTEFHAERRFLPELYLVQLHIHGGATWIVDPFHAELMQEIAPALRSVPWLVHAGEQDLRILEYALGGLPDDVLDTQIAAGLVGTDWPASYASLVDRYLGVQVDKGETLSDWSRRPLSASQLTYAALDVQLLFPLWDRIEEDLVRLGRAELARAACAEAKRAASEPASPAEVVRGLAAGPALHPQQLLVLQELAAWRSERARATNQPLRGVLSDGALVDLARRQPASAGALLANRRLPRSLGRDADEILARIERARGLPESGAPKIPRKRSPAWRAAQWLGLWAEVLGEERRFSGPLVLPRAIADELALEPPEDRDALARRLGWRDGLIGADLHQARNGAIHLSWTNGDVVGRPS